MLADQSIVAFVPTKSPEGARAFYEGTLGLRFIKDDQFALVFELSGAMLRIVKLKDFTPAQYTILGWEVRGIDEAVSRLAQQGVVFERYSWAQQSEGGVWRAPDGTGVAWFKDPDGNVLSISEHA